MNEVAPAGPRLIRTVLTAEVPDVAALHARARATYRPDGPPDDGTDWPAAWREAVERTDGQVLCAVERGRLAAVASFRSPRGGDPRTVALHQFHVDPHRWRTGIGTALHIACVEMWRADGRHTAVLDVRADNRRARAFYAHQGWVPDEGHSPAADGHHLRLRLPLLPAGR
ncbi:MULTISPECIES: GNAT family N-acetyltransferase [unclassified Streptomyces]|uniref:GNAT family N-acetyltransferase n=1 Tax=unclassified Streptomyces TaxID=2593676 RepID=UPI001F03EA81|nr:MULTISPECIES: GNAT family N-acetyltransferase [unclassified Streptomyces]MCH0562640.1 GNAT family N-acetyltransferase [Streptomyces sp. MUM 2J]MCH0567850.1 GNAT family N-acetyltransferase [Streptomyces sp. MUM 136J]